MEQFQRVLNPVNHFPNKAPSTHTEKEAKQGPRTDMEQFFKEYGTNIKSFPNKAPSTNTVKESKKFGTSKIIPKQGTQSRNDQ